MYHLYDKIKESGIDSSELPNLEEIFNKPSNLSQRSIEKIAINLLKKLTEKDDSIIKNVCSMENVSIKNFDNTISSTDNFFSDDLQEVQQNNKIEPFEYSKMFTSHSHYFLGGCLVACRNPVDFALNIGKNLINTINGIGGLKKFIKEHNEKMIEYREKLAKFNQRHNVKDEEFKKDGKRSYASTRIAGKHVKINTTDTKKRSGKYDKNERNEDLKKQEGVVEPLFNFPTQLQINTIPFLKAFNSDIFNKIESTLVRAPLLYPPHDLDVDDNIMTLLVCGVGIYTHSTNLLSQEYLDTVLQYAEHGQLAFLISDDSICYGANYPFGHVVVEDEFAMDHSIGTMFQLWGRAGRMGKSWSAHAHLTGKKSEEKFMNYLKGKSDRGTKMEADNIRSAYLIIKEERDQIKRVLLEKQVKTEKIKKVQKSNSLLAKQEALEKEQEEMERIKKEENEKIKKNAELLKTIEENQKNLSPYERSYSKRLSRDEIRNNEYSYNKSNYDRSNYNRQTENKEYVSFKKSNWRTTENKCSYNDANYNDNKEKSNSKSKQKNNTPSKSNWRNKSNANNKTTLSSKSYIPPSMRN